MREGARALILPTAKLGGKAQAFAVCPDTQSWRFALTFPGLEGSGAFPVSAIDLLRHPRHPSGFGRKGSGARG